MSVMCNKVNLKSYSNDEELDASILWDKDKVMLTVAKKV